MSALCHKQALTLFLVGGGEQRGRNLQTQCLGSRAVDNEFKFGWLLHWKVCRVATLQDLVNVCGCPPEQVGITWSVGYKPSGGDGCYAQCFASSMIRVASTLVRGSGSEIRASICLLIASANA